MATTAPTTAPIDVRVAAVRSPIDYWHLLSLDAPTVAALWSYAFCRAAHVRCQPAAALFIALGTWLLYVGDRLLDGLFVHNPEALRERHHFHARHRRAFTGAAIAVVAVLLWIAADLLPRAMLRDFAGVLTAALLYFALVHSELDWVGRWFPKELAVALIFAAAAAVPAVSRRNDSLIQSATSLILQGRGVSPPIPLEFLTAVVLFAALCWLNCIAIESWEYLPPATLRRRSGKRAPLPGSREAGWAIDRVAAIASATAASALIASLIAALFSLIAGSKSGAVRESAFLDLAVALSAVLLRLLDGASARISPLRLRIAADAALLTPLLLLVLPQIR